MADPPYPEKGNQSPKGTWQRYGLQQGPNGPMLDYFYDWLSNNRDKSFDIFTVDFKWKSQDSLEWAMVNRKAFNRDTIWELSELLHAPIPEDVPLRVFGSENIASEPLQMIADRYQINAWSFNDLFMELGNHRQGSYYSKFTGDTRPYLRAHFPTWWQVLPKELSQADYLDETLKSKRPHRYPTIHSSEGDAAAIQREVALIASKYDHCWIGIFVTEKIDWRTSSTSTLPNNTFDDHNPEYDNLMFGYDKDRQTYASLCQWLLDYIERDQMLGMTYMLRYMANSWREIIACWTSHLENITLASFSVPSLQLSKELHEMTNTFLHYRRSLHGTIDVLRAITRDEYLVHGEKPLISIDSTIHFNRVISTSEEQIRDLQDLRDRSANLIGMIFNTISIREANNAIAQGQSIKFISVLATIFVPLSLFSSMFGMNVSELGVQNGPKLHLFAAVALPGTFVLLVLAWLIRPFFTRMERKVGWITEGRVPSSPSPLLPSPPMIPPQASETGSIPRQPTTTTTTTTKFRETTPPICRVETERSDSSSWSSRLVSWKTHHQSWWQWRGGQSESSIV